MTALKPYFEITDGEVYQGDTRVFESLNLTLNHGQHSCIIGPNGAGKSTIIKLLTREIYPVVKAQSAIRWLGKEHIPIWDLRSQIGLVSNSLQNAYDAHIYGRDVVMSGLFGTIGVPQHYKINANHKELTEHALQRFHLGQIQDKRYWHLSTGQQRLLLLARAMINQPRVLILDEPTNGLDLRGSFEFMAQLRTLSQQGTTLLLITHHLQEVIPEIQRIIGLKSAKILVDAPKSEALNSRILSDLFEYPMDVTSQNGYFQASPATA